jgi:hypothetical protein
MNKAEFMVRARIATWLTSSLWTLWAMGTGVLGFVFAILISNGSGDRKAAIFAVLLGGLFVGGLVGLTWLPRILNRFCGTSCPNCQKGLASKHVLHTGTCRFCGKKVFDLEDSHDGDQ